MERWHDRLRSPHGPNSMDNLWDAYRKFNWRQYHESEMGNEVRRQLCTYDEDGCPIVKMGPGASNFLAPDQTEGYVGETWDWWAMGCWEAVGFAPPFGTSDDASCEGPRHALVLTLS